MKVKEYLDTYQKKIEVLERRMDLRLEKRVFPFVDVDETVWYDEVGEEVCTARGRKRRPIY